MNSLVSRRQLLKKGAILATGLPFAGSLLSKIMANPIASGTQATDVIVGVNVVGVDQLNEKQQDDLIEQLQQNGVKTVRTALDGHGGRYTAFVIKAFQHGIGAIIIVNPYAGNTGKHTSPTDLSVGRQWPTPALSDVDPEGFKKWFIPQFGALESAGVRVTAFELGNELNTPRFNGDFPVPGTGRVLGLSELKNPDDMVGRRIATGYLAYLGIMATLKDLRDHSQLNGTTPILSGMSANWGLSGPLKSGSIADEVSVPDSIEFLRQNGLDKLVDGYSVHFYPNNDPRQSDAERLAVLDRSGIFAASGGVSKPCWLTEWAFNHPDKACPIDDSLRLKLVQAERSAFKKYVDKGRLAALIYYSWSGGPKDNENQGAIFRCGALTDAGKLALSPM